MFAHIRKHQKWLWILISGGVIISFVWYFNPNQQYAGGGGDGRQTVGTIYGEPISQQDYNNAYKEAVLHHLFSYGQWPEDNEASRQLGIDLKSETRNRLFLISKIKQSDITVSPKSSADWIVQAFTDRQTQKFQKTSYDNFLQNIRSRGLEPKDFERYVRHQVAIQHLAAVASLPGKFVTPQEAEQKFREENLKADTIVAFVHTTNFLNQIQVTDEVLGTFFTNQLARYRLPERVQLSYVAFPFSNYGAQAEEAVAKLPNFDQQVDQIYTQRGANFYTDPTGQIMTPEAAKAQIRQELLSEAAKLEARKAAIQFATPLVDNPISPNPANPAAPLEKLAAEQNLQVQVTQPFSQFEGPQELLVPDRLGRTAFMLTPEEPIISEPVVGEDSVYVMALKQRVPSDVPEFAAIRDQVLEDYKRSEAQRLAREAGANFARTAATLTNSTDFAQAAVNNGLTIMNLPPVPKTGRMIPELEARPDAGSIRNTAFNLNEGETSGFIPTREGGFVLHLEKLISVSDEELNRDLPAFVEELRRRRAAEAFQDWFRNELQLAGLRLAGDEQESPAGF